MEDSPKIPPPIASDGMNIHLSYVRRDIDEIKAILKDMKSGYVTRSDFDDHLGVANDHELRIRIIEKNMWKWSGISGVLGGAIAVFGVYLIQTLLK